jgi:hypothetical protein
MVGLADKWPTVAFNVASRSCFPTAVLRKIIAPLIEQAGQSDLKATSLSRKEPAFAQSLISLFKVS